MSENYYIALENPISMDFSTLLLRYMTGRACLAECLKYDPRKRTKIHLILRPGRSGVLLSFCTAPLMAYRFEYLAPKSA